MTGRRVIDTISALTDWPATPDARYSLLGHTHAYAPVSHAHAGEDITSGTVADARIAASLSGKTLVTPTIASFVNAQHNHSNAAGGGTVSGGAPGGATTQVQFNDGGAFGGDAGLIYNKTDDKLGIGKTPTATAGFSLDLLSGLHMDGTLIQTSAASYSFRMSDAANRQATWSFANLLGTNDFLFQMTTPGSGWGIIESVQVGLAMMTFGSIPIVVAPNRAETVRWVAAGSSTNTIVSSQTFKHNIAGTPAAGYGVALAAQLKSSTTNSQDAGRITWQWDDATHASRASKGQLSAYYTSIERPAITWGANSSVALLSFYDVTAPIARQVLATGAGRTVDDVITFLQNLGLAKQS